MSWQYTILVCTFTLFCAFVIHKVSQLQIKRMEHTNRISDQKLEYMKEFNYWKAITLCFENEAKENKSNVEEVKNVI